MWAPLSLTRLCQPWGQLEGHPGQVTALGQQPWRLYVFGQAPREAVASYSGLASSTAQAGLCPHCTAGCMCAPTPSPTCGWGAGLTVPGVHAKGTCGGHVGPKQPNAWPRVLPPSRTLRLLPHHEPHSAVWSETTGALHVVGSPQEAPVTARGPGLPIRGPHTCCPTRIQRPCVWW